MKNLLPIIWHIFTTLFRLLTPNGTKAIIAENIALRRQLLILSRKHKRSPNLTTSDRFIFAWCAGNLSVQRIIKNVIIIKPATILKFHRYPKEKKYQQLYTSRPRRKPGPKGPSQAIINAIVEMKRRNPRFGGPKIAEQINLAFGLNLNKDVVRRVLEKHYSPDNNNNGGPSWLTFLGHCKDSLWSVDLFRCESANLKSHWVMVVMDQFSRRIVGFAVHTGNPSGVDICRMFNQIHSQQPLPQHLSSDNDPLFKYHRWQANLRIMEIEEIKTVPHVPISHPFVERLIGTVRRELLDHTLFWGEMDLQRKLDQFKDYYNQHRTHSSRAGKPPIEIPRKMADLSNFSWEKHCRGLFQLPILT